MKAIIGIGAHLNEIVENISKLCKIFTITTTKDATLELRDFHSYLATLKHHWGQTKLKPRYNRQADWETTPATPAPIIALVLLFIVII